MPGFDGTGPLGQGPMTGRGQGFCVLTNLEENPGQVKGIAGLQSVPVGQVNRNYENSGKEVINMPFGGGTDPVGLGPMTGRAAGFCAGYPTPGYMSRAGFYGVVAPIVGPYGAGYSMPYVGRVNPWLRRGFGFGRGRGWGRGRGGGRFRFRW